VITGAASGMGLASAKLFVEERAYVFTSPTEGALRGFQSSASEDGLSSKVCDCRRRRIPNVIGLKVCHELRG
jgi:NAD(P)-dependent dehydrogenase (short-subunit alcohol dehydrogenase family)